MDVSNILRPHELPFEPTPNVAQAIRDLIGALEREDRLLDCYLDELQGIAREQSEEEDMWIRRYYVNWGWEHGVPTD